MQIPHTQRTTPNRLRFLLMALVVLGVSSLACGDIFDEENADISYDVDFDFDVPIDADMLCPSGADCSGMAVDSPADRELRPIDVNVDINIVEASGVDELDDYAGKFKSISISRIEYDVPENTLTADVPDLTLYLGPPGSEEVDASGVVEVGTIPTIPAGETVQNGQANIVAANTEAQSELLQSLNLALLARATPVVKMGQPFPPSGATEITVTIFVTFVVNPLENN